MKLTLLANNSVVSSAERRELDGTDHLVVHVVALKEGVLNNIFYHANEISTFPEAWNGVPVPVNHPTDGSGNISANSVDVEETVNIGKFYNVQFNDKKKSLEGEIWINIDKAERLGFSSLVTHLEDGGIMEVSTGLFSNTIESLGEYEGEAYTHSATGIRPDHLALLPDTEGACSVADGCGVRTNNKCTCPDKGANCGESCKSPTTNEETFFKRIINKLFNNDKSHSDMRSMIRVKLSETYGEDPYPYILDVFDTYVIFEMGSDLFKQSYAMDDNKNEANLIGERMQVKLETMYTPITTNKENMKTPVERTALIDKIVANSKDITDDQKNGLSALSDEMLDSLVANSQEPSGAGEKAAPATPAPVTNGLAEDDRQLLEKLKANEATRVEGLRANVASYYGHLNKEAVDAMPIEAVEALAGAIPAQTGIQANYAAAAGAAPVANEAASYEPPSVLLGE